MATGIVYKLTNMLNSKAYVGKTMVGLRERVWQHKSRARDSNRRGNTYLYNAMRKYGSENFFIEVLEEGLTEEEANTKEIEWISKLGTLDPDKGYNCTPGGDGATHGPSSKVKQKGWRTVSVETREKLRKANKGRKLAPEQVERMRTRLIGKKQAPEHVAKRSSTNREVWKDPERKARQAEASRKRLEDSGIQIWNLQTPESIMRAEQSREVWRNSPEGIKFLDKVSRLHTGKHNSADLKKGWETRRANPDKLNQQRERIRASKLAWWSNPENRERVRLTRENNKLASQGGI